MTDTDALLARLVEAEERVVAAGEALIAECARVRVTLAALKKILEEGKG